MISFRLTQAEYDKCRELCFSHGIRSVSEMSRLAINLLIEQPVGVCDGTIQSRMTELESRVQILALEVRKLRQC